MRCSSRIRLGQNASGPATPTRVMICPAHQRRPWLRPNTTASSAKIPSPGQGCRLPQWTREVALPGEDFFPVAVNNPGWDHSPIRHRAQAETGRSTSTRAPGSRTIGAAGGQSGRRHGATANACGRNGQSNRGKPLLLLFDARKILFWTAALVHVGAVLQRSQRDRRPERWVNSCTESHLSL